MKNQYFGDINDYLKYGLLRILCNNGQFNIGICWMLTDNDELSDGGKIDYLDKPQKWEKYDQQLFIHLKQVINKNLYRKVQLIQDERIFPGVTFFDQKLTDNLNNRLAYFEQNHQLLINSELIFFDPDNGIEVKSVPKGCKNSSKYIYWDEIYDAFQTGKSVLVYQHFRRENRDSFITKMLAEYKNHLGVSNIHYFRASNVVYFLAAQPKHEKYICDCAIKCEEIWREQFSVDV